MPAPRTLDMRDGAEINGGGHGSRRGGKNTVAPRCSRRGEGLPAGTPPCPASPVAATVRGQAHSVTELNRTHELSQTSVRSWNVFGRGPPRGTGDHWKSMENTGNPGPEPKIPNFHKVLREIYVPTFFFCLRFESRKCAGLGPAEICTFVVHESWTSNPCPNFRLPERGKGRGSEGGTGRELENSSRG